MWDGHLAAGRVEAPSAIEQEGAAGERSDLFAGGRLVRRHAVAGERYAFGTFRGDVLKLQPVVGRDVADHRHGR